jgi:hypothetical protein
VGSLVASFRAVLSVASAQAFQSHIENPIVPYKIPVLLFHSTKTNWASEWSFSQAQAAPQTLLTYPAGGPLDARSNGYRT